MSTPIANRRTHRKRLSTTGLDVRSLRHVGSTGGFRAYDGFCQTIMHLKSVCNSACQQAGQYIFMLPPRRNNSGTTHMFLRYAAKVLIVRQPLPLTQHVDWVSLFRSDIQMIFFWSVADRNPLAQDRLEPCQLPWLLEGGTSASIQATCGKQGRSCFFRGPRLTDVSLFLRSRIIDPKRDGWRCVLGIF